MTGKFYTLDYVPNRLAYVYDENKDDIKFLAFFKEKGSLKIKAIKHSASKKSKRDFKKPKFCYNPTPEILRMIKEALNN